MTAKKVVKSTTPKKGISKSASKPAKPDATYTIKFPEIDPSDLWTLANDIERLSYKVGNIQALAELLAASLSQMPESGAAWAISDMAELYGNELEALSGRCMELRRPSKGIE